MHRTVARNLFAVILLALTFAAIPALAAEPDLVIFTNGERLTGELATADSAGITFNSAMAGTVKVAWANIAELHSSKKFAVLDSRVKLRRRDAASLTPVGTLEVDTKSKTLIVATTSGPKSVPIANASRLLDPAAFDKTVNHPPDFVHGFAGQATVGASFVRATQNSATFNGGLGLVRTSPGVDWLPPHDRTTLNLNEAYGTTSQPNTPSVETNIFHADAEQDEYVSPRFFAFVSTAFDHNFSSQLQLQQAYGGGFGMTVVKTPIQQLDVKANVQFVEQQFFTTVANPVLAPSQSIIGSLFSDTYTRKLTKSITFNEFASISPAWNTPADYSAHAAASLLFPVYHGLAFNLGVIDDYLHNAPVGSQQNSFQFVTGITYKIK